jgi:hypothetical protein
MNLPKYQVAASTPYLYHFYSEGPQGSIKKAIIYAQIEDNLFNLAFGDWDEESRRINDSSRTNNQDRDKVLATVAFTALDFTNQFPHVEIFAEGTTSARTRLYQMEIGNNLMEINRYFKIEGFVNGEWEFFLRGKNYEAFLIYRK